MAQVRLHVVTGKGGTGKTTVSATLAIALAIGGRRVLVAEVEDRQGIAQVLDSPPLPYAEQYLVAARGGGEVYGLAVEPRQALLEYLEMYYHLGRAGRTLERIGAVEFATTVAPGLRDVLLTGKVYESTRRRAGAQFAYDAIVLDGPPTGRIARFLNVTGEVAGLARVGPIHRQAESITNLFHSPTTAVHIVTQLEEMPAQETADAVEELGAAGLNVGYLILNMTSPPGLRPRDITDIRNGEVDEARIEAALAKAGADAPGVASQLLSEAQRFAERAAVERASRRLLRDLDRPVLELPLVTGGIDVAAVYELAEALRDSGVG
jgi:anion-transporting  ArsA/GET3 family ATPase